VTDYDAIVIGSGLGELALASVVASTHTRAPLQKAARPARAERRTCTIKFS